MSDFLRVQRALLIISEFFVKGARAPTRSMTDTTQHRCLPLPARQDPPTIRLNHYHLNHPPQTPRPRARMAHRWKSSTLKKLILLTSRPCNLLKARTKLTTRPHTRATKMRPITLLSRKYAKYRGNWTGRRNHRLSPTIRQKQHYTHARPGLLHNPNCNIASSRRKVLGVNLFRASHHFDIPISLAAIFTNPGVNSGLTKYLAQYRSENRQGDLKTFMTAGLLINITASLTLMLIVNLSSGYLASKVFNQPEIQLLI